MIDVSVNTSRTRLTVCCIAALGAAIRLAIWVRPYEVIDRVYVPDDTYYTLTIARSLARGDGPTVDGETLTSGFQALHGFLLVPIFWLTDSPIAAARANAALLLAADVITIVLLGWLAHRLAGPAAGILAAGLWAASPLAIGMAIGGLENSLALLCEVGLVVAWVRANDRPGGRRWALVGVVAGLAVLARVDAALLVALLAGLQLWRGHRRALLGWGPLAALVLAPWWGWCWWVLGSPFPSSGEAAHQLSPYGPFDEPLLAMAAGAVSGGPAGSLVDTRAWLATHPSSGPAAFAAVLVVLAIVTAWWLAPRAAAAPTGREPTAGKRATAGRAAGAATAADDDADRKVAAGRAAAAGEAAGRRPPTAGDTGRDRREPGDMRQAGPWARLGAGALAAFGIGLCLFYAWFGVAWYYYRYLSPVGMTAVVTVAAVGGGAWSWARRAGLRRVVALPALAAVAVVVVATGWRGARFVRLPAPEAVYGEADTGRLEAAGQVLAHVPAGERVGAWQSGALGYLADERVTVVNLDGVVNPDAARAAAEGSMPAYVDGMGLTYLADWSLFVLGHENERAEQAYPLNSLVAVIEHPGEPLDTLVVCCRDGDSPGTPSATTVLVGGPPP